jgi:O-antigen ligase
VRAYLTPLLFFQRFFLPAVICLLLWAMWQTLQRKDVAVGLGLYLGVLIIVDGFLNTSLFLPGLQQGSIRYSEVCAAFILGSRPAKSARSAPYGAIAFVVGAYFVLLLLSVFRANPVMAGVADFRMRIVPQIVAFLIAKRGLQSPESLRRFLFCMTAISVIIGLFVFWDLFFDRWLINSDMLSKPEYWANRKQGRYGSFFLNPNLLGAYTVLLFPSVFVWTLGEKGKARLFGALGLMTLIFCLVETQSRGPLLAMGVVLLLLVVGPAGDMTRKRRIGVFLPFAALLVILMPGFFEHASERFDRVDVEMSTDSARTRQTIWNYTQRAISDNPLLGIGFGEKQFVSVIRDVYGFERTYGEESLDNPHNSYLQMTVYAGFPALFMFIAANGLLLFAGVRASIRTVLGPQTHLLFGIAVGIAGFLTACYPDMHMFTQTVAPVYWVFFALLLSYSTSLAPAPALARLEPAAQGKQYEDSGPVVRNGRQHVAGQSVFFTPRDRRDGPGAASAGGNGRAEGGTAPADDPPLRRRAHVQQAAVQPGPLALPFGGRRADDDREFFSGRRADALRPAGADPRRAKH